MSIRAKSCILEPIGRKFARTVGHVFTAKNAERQHLFWCQFRTKFGMKVAPDRLDEQVSIVLLHFVVNFDPPFFHIRYGSNNFGHPRQVTAATMVSSLLLY